MSPNRTRSARFFVWRVTVLAGLLLTTFTASNARASAQAAPAVRAPRIGLGLNVPTGIASAGSRLFVTNGGNSSVTEVNSSTGRKITTIASGRYGLDGPSAVVAVAGDVFVANALGNSITELKATGRRHVRTIEGPAYGFSDPIALASSGNSLYVLNGTGGVTAVSAGTGALLGTASGPAYSFDVPTGLAVADGLVFVANSASNTVTVLSATNLTFVALLSDPAFGFSTPISMAFDGTDLWVTNQGDDSVTELSPSTLQPVNVLVSGNLPMVGPITYGDGYVFTLSPPGGSPMVSQIVPSQVAVTWMMCNTNGPYLFDDPQSLVVTGSHLWVANEGGNSLTEMDADSGALIRTVS